MDKDFKKLFERVEPIASLKLFIEENDIRSYKFTEDGRRLICHSGKNEETIFHIGQKYQSESEEKLINEGCIILNGVGGKNWIYLLNIGSELKFK